MCVMDNLTVHHSKVVMRHFDEDFQAFFLPPYSSAMNPIERLWNIVKQQWRNLLIKQELNESIDDDGVVK